MGSRSSPAPKAGRAEQQRLVDVVMQDLAEALQIEARESDAQVLGKRVAKAVGMAAPLALGHLVRRRAGRRSGKGGNAQVHHVDSLWSE